jgi:D-inositol-3-phosphate glycosyltransferase
MKPKLLWVGDAGCPSGFARATHEVLDVMRHEFDVTVLGMNYRGDPHSYPYPIYAAAPGGDAFGIGRLIWMCDVVKPDAIVIQQDGWNLPFYTDQLARFKEYATIPVIAFVAVDGKNFRKEWLRGVSLAIFWTEFALNEARESGYEGSGMVIPLGVDTDVFYPEDRKEARQRLRLPPEVYNAFIVGNVNRNQPRKRWDLTVKYFAEWIKSKEIRDAYLFLHTAPTGDTGVDVKQLTVYYGIADRIMLVQPPTWYGAPDEHMRNTYNAFDVQVTTTQGEGFGLTTFEGMACGVPQIVPDWSALGDLCKDAAWMVPCTSTAIGPPYVNVIGGVPDQAKFTQALDSLYRNAHYRERNSKAAIERANEHRFRWAHIGQAFTDAVTTQLALQGVPA